MSAYFPLKDLVKENFLPDASMLNWVIAPVYAVLHRRSGSMPFSACVVRLQRRVKMFSISLCHVQLIFDGGGSEISGRQRYPREHFVLKTSLWFHQMTGDLTGKACDWERSILEKMVEMANYVPCKTGLVCQLDSWSNCNRFIAAGNILDTLKLHCIWDKIQTVFLGTPDFLWHLYWSLFLNLCYF